MELTVLWEDGCEEAFERKSESYRDLMQGCRGKAGLVVGCRGFPAQSVWKLLTAVGLRGSERSSRESLLLDMEQEGGVELEARRERVVTGHHC